MAHPESTTSATQQQTGTEERNSMSTQQGSSRHAGHSTGTQELHRSSQHGKSHAAAAHSDEQATGVQNTTYNLVSVLYHALQGAQACMQYAHDAQEKKDEELVQFFQEAQECQRHLVSRAEEVLGPRLQQGNGNGHRTGHGQQNRGTAHRGSTEASSISPGAEVGAGATSGGSERIAK